MANSKSPTSDSAEALHGLINDVLVQTGKALKSLSKDGRHQFQAQISLQTKMPEIIESFHWKLDDLESEIIRAKAALQRDLDRFQQAKARQPVQQPAPVDAQTKSPMAIDLDSSSREPSPPENKTQITEATGPHRVPAEPSTAPPSMAPFPDMGVSFQPAPEPSPQVKQETTPAPPAAPPAMMAPMGEIKQELKTTPPGSQPQPSGAPEAPMDDLFGLGSDSGGGTEGNNPEFHFTDMTFSLAPPNNEAQDQAQSQDTAMDMSFGSGDMGGDLLTLDNLLPPDNATKQEAGSAPPAAAAAATAAAAAAAAAANQEKPVEAKMEKQESSNLDDLFNLDGNTSMENMDLDMNMGGDGGDGNSFDDMFFGDMTEMEHGKFDDAFFGIQ
ncbi:hypothetical protein CORC01_11911 [Colletotrichum orchidophilum]|uniref:Uncharacterized protein n=1 Tax=Colletotrichum orchidophilum TaxID=1209926 RepID=A0A1G4AUH9_9PEZI|nr:uncharacterized protein CORC01_11911 [Colletotrichum orchidophilum]OHE92761.1 hypothetical protein CORC01_11911 [Colletotrichum orchidophilum]